METKNSLIDLRKGVIFLATLLVVAFLSIMPAMANDLDPLGGGGSGSSEEAPTNIDQLMGGSPNSGQQNAPAPTTQNAPSPNQNREPTPEDRELQERINNEVSKNNSGREFIDNYNPLGDYNPNESAFQSWVLAAIGKVTSFLIWAVVGFFFLVTALDFMYILVPFMRPLLADPNEDGQGNSMPGFGGGPAAMGGFGAGGANQTAQKKSLFNRQWVSDEAVNSVKLLGGSAQAQMGGGGMMGNPMGGMGGFGAMGAVPEQDSNSRKTVMGDYVKARIKVIILLGVAMVLLTSSTLMGFGMDVGTWILKVILFFGDKLSGTDVTTLFN